MNIKKYPNQNKLIIQIKLNNLFYIIIIFPFKY